MKRLISILVIFLFTLSAFGSDSLTVFYRIRLDQDIDPSSQRLVTLGLEKAREAQADYILLDLDTYGGAVNAATELAKAFGGSDKFIAITVMAAGTSMPELATCVVAALKGRGQLALGNVLGSNISNILLILGGSALLTPLSFSGMTYVDLGALLASALFILASAYCFKKKQLDRFEGIILLSAEIGYMWYLIANI